MENDKKNIQQEETPMTLKDIWALCISHWKWFALSVILYLAVAAFYILKTVPVFSRSASVMIKEDRRSGSVSDITAAFTDLGVGQTWVNVSNELVNFSSPDLILQVVKNLNLDVNYIRDGFFHDHTSMAVRFRLRCVSWTSRPMQPLLLP